MTSICEIINDWKKLLGYAPRLSWGEIELDPEYFLDIITETLDYFKNTPAAGENRPRELEAFALIGAFASYPVISGSEPLAIMFQAMTLVAQAMKEAILNDRYDGATIISAADSPVKFEYDLGKGDISSIVEALKRQNEELIQKTVKPTKSRKRS